MSNRQPISTFPGIAAAVVLAANSYAADINVPGDQPTIQAGIDAANPGDVVIVAQGVYFESINFNGKAITVRSTDPDDPDVVATTVIDGTGNLHVVQCVTKEGPGTVLSGFVVTGGLAIGDGNDADGGGMLNLGSSPTVMRCTFTGNSAFGFGSGGAGMANFGGSPTVTGCTFDGNMASNGGGMLNFNSSPTVTDCTFSGNEALGFEGDGGGIANIGPLSAPNVINCTFVGNTANLFGGGMFNHFLSNPTIVGCTFDANMANQGGGVYDANNGMLDSCTFTGNTASTGGGMMAEDSTAMVTNCTFSGNTATSSGGGMANTGVDSPTVADCTFSGNSAARGGGMRNGGFIGSSPTVINCTFTGNTAETGGAIWNGGNFGTSSPTVINCTFSGNTASDSGGGFYNDDFSDPSNSTVTNCVLWSNSPNQIDDVGSSATTVRYSDVQGGWSGSGSNNIDADPLFIDPLNGDFRLSPGSPSIDAGDNTAVPLEITTDLDGNPRFVDDPDTPDTGLGQPPIVDMGAYELQLGDDDDDSSSDSSSSDSSSDDSSSSDSSSSDSSSDDSSSDDSSSDDSSSGGAAADSGGVPQAPALSIPEDVASCPKDINRDGIVDVVDLGDLLLCFGRSPVSGCESEDVNADGSVDVLDLLDLLLAVGTTCP